MPPPNRDSFIPLNLPVNSIPESMGDFSLSAPPGSDLWREPPQRQQTLVRDIVSAPILYTRLRHSFTSAVVTVCANWELEWDQAGLLIFTGEPPGHLASRNGSPPPHTPSSKWVKVGMEFNDQSFNVTSVYATPDGADWSRSALPGHHSRRADLSVKLERNGHTLRVHYDDSLFGWKKVREITWFFLGVEDKRVWVGVYASRPNSLAGDLHVDFSDLEIY